MNELQIFKHPIFGQIRTLEENGRTLLCGADATKALGYKNTRDALAKHCRGVVKRDIPHPQSAGKTIEMSFITDGDLCRLAAQSKLPGAAAFESWIFDDVIPNVLRHGGYLTPAKIEEVLFDPDTIITLATQLKTERAEKQALALENAQQKQLLAEYEPKIQYVDKILSSTGTLAISQIAADYGLTAQRLNRILHEERVQRKVNGQWLLYREYMNLGYTKSESVPIVHKDGRDDFNLHTKWTQKGRLFIHELLQRRGIRAIIDREPQGTQQVI